MVTAGGGVVAAAGGGVDVGVGEGNVAVLGSLPSTPTQYSRPTMRSSQLVLSSGFMVKSSSRVIPLPLAMLAQVVSVVTRT